MKETAVVITRKISDFVDDVKDKIEKAELDEKFDEAKKKVVEVANDLKDKAIDIKDDIEVVKIHQVGEDVQYYVDKDDLDGLIKVLKCE